MNEMDSLFDRECENYILAKNRSMMAYALLLSTLWHGVAFGLPFIFQIFNAPNVYPDLASANKPTITIELVSAEQGKSRNEILSTQKIGGIRRVAQQKKSVNKSSTRNSANNNLAKKSSYRYSKKMRPRHRVKTSRRDTRPVKRAAISETMNFVSSAANGGDRPPLYRIGSANNPRPPYPYLARKRGWQGRVVLSVYVDQDGVAVKVLIKKGSGHSILDRSAMLTIEKWKFKPSLKGGKNVAAIVPVPVKFTLLQ